MGRAASTSTSGYRVQLDLPPVLYRWFADEAARRSATVDQVVRQALDRFAEAEEASFDIRQTRTWQLCGALEVSEPDPEYVVGCDEQGREITNYAENADALLYRGG